MARAIKAGAILEYFSKDLIFCATDNERLVDLLWVGRKLWAVKDARRRCEMLTAKTSIGKTIRRTSFVVHHDIAVNVCLP